MKLLLLTLFCLSFVFPAAAYLETETELSAGEQNSGLYNLNASTEVKMKQLKKISEAMERNPDLDYRDTDVFEKMLSGRSEVDIETEAKQQKLFDEVVRRTASKKTLVVSAVDVLQQLQNVQNQIKDRDAVVQLRQQIRRR